MRSWKLAHGRELRLGARSLVMGILNVTPDSFSDGGRYDVSETAFAHASRMAEEGADIIDVGGESTRPGADAVDSLEEQRRVLPVVEEIAQKLDVAVSVDTYRETTARLAVSAGAHIINDVWGLQRDGAIAKLAAETGAGLVAMHTGRERRKRDDVIADQFEFLTRTMKIAAAAGVEDGRLVLDPGFGFAKDADENLRLMSRFDELMALHDRWLVGTSRKRFIGSITGREAQDRGVGTAATSVMLRLKGADIFRVHDVAINVDALRMVDAMIGSAWREAGGR